jgi:hypothetical protein
MPRYLVDLDTNIVHDTRYERPECKLNRIPSLIAFSLDTIEEEKRLKYTSCKHCRVEEAIQNQNVVSHQKT